MSRTIPVVLVHGAGQDAEIWDGVTPLLTAPIHVHELPGHGRRGGAPLISIVAMADDVAAACPERSVLVGHSMGGAVVLTAAARHPGAVVGVVVVCAALDARPDARVLAALRARSMDAFLPYVRPGIVGFARAPSPMAEASARRLEAVVARHPVEVLLADYEAVSASDLTRVLDDVQVPVTVLAGERDALVRPRRVAALAAAFGVTARIVPGASHQVPWEAPAVVAAAVEELRTETRG